MGTQKTKGGMGFRDLDSFNIALLAKQVWRFLQHPNSLATIIFREKYFKSKYLLDAKLGSNPFLIWRSLGFSELIKEWAEMESREWQKYLCVGSQVT